MAEVAKEQKEIKRKKLKIIIKEEIEHKKPKIRIIEEEEWKSLHSLGLDKYEISSTGRVRNIESEHIFRGKPSKTNGYVAIGIRLNNKKKYFYVHVLVAKILYQILKISHR